MAFRADWTGIKGLAKEIEADGASAVRLGMEDATEATLQDVRAETAGAFQGNRLPKTWRARVFPQARDSLDAAGWIETRAPNIIGPSATGATIRAKGGTWLAIPTREAGKYGLRRDANLSFGQSINRRGAKERISPGGFERLTGLKLRFVFLGPHRAMLVVDNAMYGRNSQGNRIRAYRGRGRGSRLYGPDGQTIVVFTLVPQVRMKKRLDLDAVASRGGDRAAAAIVKHWRA
jgi:hypothetical protein